MTLAELVIGIKNGSLVNREPPEDEIRDRFEHFRERNRLVEEVLEGNITFREALRSSKPLSKRLPFAKKMEDFRNLEYLLAVPIAYEEFNVRKGSFENPIIVPKDYYEKALHYRLSESDIMVRGFMGIFHIIKYFALPGIAGVISGNVTNAISPDAALPVAYGTIALTATALVAWDIYRTVTIPRDMTNRAKMLDKLVAKVFNPDTTNEKSGNYESGKNYERRDTLVTQWLNSSNIYFNDKQFDRAIDFALKAIKLDPLNLSAREMLIMTYSITSDARCFDELKEARVIFDHKIDYLDMTASTLYGERNNVDGYKSKLIDSAMNRAGIGAALDLRKSIEKKMQT